MRTYQLDYHDRGPPEQSNELELLRLLDTVGTRSYTMTAGQLTHIDFETILSEDELCMLVVDNIRFIGQFSIDDEIKIVQEEHHHANFNTNKGIIAAE